MFISIGLVCSPGGGVGSITVVRWAASISTSTSISTIGSSIGSGRRSLRAEEGGGGVGGSLTELHQLVEDVLDFNSAVAEVFEAEVHVLVEHLLHTNNLDNEEDGEDELPCLIDGVEEEALDGVDSQHEVTRDTLRLGSFQDGVGSGREDDFGKLLNPVLGTCLGESGVVCGDEGRGTGGSIVIGCFEALHI